MPESAGPQSETEDFSPQPLQGGWRIGAIPKPNAYTDPAQDPAIRRTLRAEAAADALKQVPPDATDLTVPVTPPVPPEPAADPPKPKRSHHKQPPAPAAEKPADTPEEAP